MSTLRIQLFFIATSNLYEALSPFVEEATRLFEKEENVDVDIKISTCVARYLSSIAESMEALYDAEQALPRVIPTNEQRRAEAHRLDGRYHRPEYSRSRGYPSEYSYEPVDRRHGYPVSAAKPDVVEDVG